VFAVAGLPVVALVEQAPLAGAPKKRRAARQRSAGAALHRRAIAHRRPGARPRDADERRGHKGSYGVGTICAVPGRLVAPGPGRSATVLTVPLAAAGVQKADACTAPERGAPSVRLPAHTPVSLMHRVAGLPSAPGFVW